MRAVSESEVLATLPSILKKVETESVAIQQDGREVAYIISPQEYEFTREAKRQRLVRATKTLSDEIQTAVREKGLDLDDLMSSLDRKAS